MNTADIQNNTNPTLFYGGVAVVDYYGADNDNYVAGEGFCCGDNNLKTKSIADDSPNYEKLQYYYHSDHLGSASYITNLDGEVVQHIEYVPFGEVFLEERNNTWNTPYLFNGKELDEETGLYYYGARYYNPRISLWYGVDPLAEKYPTHSPYCYTMNNPIMLVDPNGEEPISATFAIYIGTSYLLSNTSSPTARSIGYSMRNPINALKVNSPWRTNINDVATNFQVNIGIAIGDLSNTPGSKQNAIRHTLWQAISARDLGSLEAAKIADAHEVRDARHVNTNQRSFDSLEDADLVIDLLNNRIGRKIGEGNDNLTNTDIAKRVMEQYYNEGLWTVKENDSGGFDINKTRITKEEYDQSINEINRKGESGLNKE